MPANDIAQPPADPAANPAAGDGNAANAAAPAASAVPAAYDWTFSTHGGSGDLDFGDGDQAEGVSLFHLSCLPNSGRVEMSWRQEGPATLSAGGQSERFGGRRVGERDPARAPALRTQRQSHAWCERQDDALNGQARRKAAVRTSSALQHGARR